MGVGLAKFQITYQPSAILTQSTLLANAAGGDREADVQLGDAGDDAHGKRAATAASRVSYRLASCAARNAAEGQGLNNEL